MATTDDLLSELRRRHNMSDAMNQGRPDPIWEHCIVVITEQRDRIGTLSTELRRASMHDGSAGGRTDDR